LITLIIGWWFPPVLFAVLAVLLAIGPARTVLSGATGRDLIPVLRDTGLAMLLWSAVAAAALAFGRSLHPAAGTQKVLHGLGVRLEVQALLRHPVVVVVRLRVPLTAVAEQCDDAALLARLQHPGDELERAVEVGAGGAARPVAGAPAQQPDRGQGRGIRHLDHLVDHRGHERRLHARPADPFDTGRHAGGVVHRPGLPRPVERGVLRVDHRDLGPVAPVSDVAADGGAGAAGARADHDPAWDRVPLQ